jgi:hypothetical protein
MSANLSPNQGNIYLGVLLFHDPHSEMWIAQAIEHDISASGPTVEAAQLAFERVVAGYLALDQRHQREPFSTLRPAPQVFAKAWQRIAQKQTQALHIQNFDAYAIQATMNEPPALTM